MKVQGQVRATIPLPAMADHFSAITFLTFSKPPVEPDVLLNLTRTIGYTSQSRLSHFGQVSLKTDAVSDRLRSLSGKQMEILRWMSEGKSNSEISIILSIPARQVDYHAKQIFDKLGVTNRIKAAVIYASR